VDGRARGHSGETEHDGAVRRLGWGEKIGYSLVAYAVRGAVSAYYFKYYVGREDLLGRFLVANGVFSLLGIGMTRPIAKHVRKELAERRGARGEAAPA
jgi:Na+/melibiose symporter-like transporter